MNELNCAYRTLGVNDSMSLEEIETVYEDLLRKYSAEAKRNMYYEQKLIEWKEAYECILKNRIDEEEEDCELFLIDKVRESIRGLKLVHIIIVFILIILSMIMIGKGDWFYSLRHKDNSDVTLSYKNEVSALGLNELSNQFTLTLANFNDQAKWDWGYYENGTSWTVIAAIEVSDSNDLGAFINLYNFRLGDDYPTTYIPEDIYLDQDLNRVHYLGEFSELIPRYQKFGIVFQVNSFEQGEERVIYYHHPDGTKQVVATLIFEPTEGKTEDKGILVYLN